MPMKRSGRSVEAASRVIEIDEVLVPMTASVFRKAQSLPKIALVLADGLLANLPRHVPVDGRDAGLDTVGFDVVELHLEARQRAHMCDTAAHLTGADHADFLDAQCHDVRLGLPPSAQS